MSDTFVPDYVLWPYTPTVAAGAIAAMVFFLLTGLHAWRLIQNRTWFCIPFVVGGFCEAIGYAARAAAHNDTDSITPYIMQSSLILIAPILFAASVYMILGRLIRRTDSVSYCMIRAKWVTKIFLAGDLFCAMIQGSGAGLLVSAKDAAGFKSGENIILGGLILQILIFVFFVVVASGWHRRLSAVPTAAAAEIQWKKYVWLLYGASALITVRNLCRVIEYAMGKVSRSSATRCGDYQLTNNRMATCFLTNGHSTSMTSCPWCSLSLCASRGTTQISSLGRRRTSNLASADRIRSITQACQRHGKATTDRCSLFRGNTFELAFLAHESCTLLRGVGFSAFSFVPSLGARPCSLLRRTEGSTEKEYHYKASSLSHYPLHWLCLKVATAETLSHAVLRARQLPARSLSNVLHVCVRNGDLSYCPATLTSARLCRAPRPNLQLS